MASDLSSGCTDDIDIFEEKEEGELSLEDVSSSEESHPNYRSDFRVAGRCVGCMSMQMCAPWCGSARAARKTHRKQDAAHGKENRRHAKEPSAGLAKQQQQQHQVATLQEKNDDLVPISSDSDMEIVGLPGNSKQQQQHARTKAAKVRKKKKKKRGHSSAMRIEGSLSPPQVETYLVEIPAAMKVRPSRSHHREPSPPPPPPRFALDRPVARSPTRRYRATRAPKSRSPPRSSRSPAARATLGERKSPRRSRSPAARSSLTERKSPRKLRSPRRSPLSQPPAAPRSPVRSGQCRNPRDRVSSPPETRVDTYATQLLKKVRRLESVSGGSAKDLARSKEHSSLKEKLSNMMKNRTENNEKPGARKRDNVASVAANNNNDNDGAAATNGVATAAAETDEEDDIELLRRLALETKQKKAEMKVEEPRTKSKSVNVEESDDNDNEANQLRILALRSAIIKKHEKRVTRGVKSRKPARPANRVESPFNESFLDDFRVSGDEDAAGAESPSARLSPLGDEGSGNHPEDMDLDTDVEREKENDFMSPYSPTDDLSRGIVVTEDELPNDEDGKSSPTRDEQDERIGRRDSSERTGYLAGVDTPYSPSAPTETPNPGRFVARRRSRAGRARIAGENGEISSSSESDSLSYYLAGVDTPFSPPATPEALKTRRFTLGSKNVTETDSPMSPTETSMLDPVLFPIFPNLPAVTSDSQRNVDVNEDEKGAEKETDKPETAVVRDLESTALERSVNEAAQTIEDSSVAKGDQEGERRESPRDATIAAAPLTENFFRPIDAIDKLPEVDLDGSPLVPVSKELEGVDLIIPIENSPEIQDLEVEPLYLQSLSEVTRDTSKIPTLVNRTLVPALILKTNKQLQQPLPQKKVDSHAEPSFKSAEMRPVSVETEPVKSATLFKPIKLCPIAKKPQVMTTAAAAFSASFGDESVTETKSDGESARPEPPASVRDARAATVVEKTQKAVETPGEAKKSTAGSKKGGRVKSKKRFSADMEAPSSSKESSAGRKKSGESTATASSGKKAKSSASGERVTRASIKSSLVESFENLKENVLKAPEEKSAQRRTSVARSDKTTASKKDSGEDGERKKKKTRRSKKKLKRLSSSSAGKSSDVDATRSVEQNAEKTGDKEQTETNKNNGESSKAGEESRKSDEAERKRRCSVDEDEEALRALLLASLPKRTKPVETSQSTPPTIPVAKISQPLDRAIGTSVENSAIKAANEPTPTIAPINPSALPSQSSTAISAIPAKVEAATTTTTTTTSVEAAGTILASESTTPLTPRKRANSVVIKGPPKKIVKKASPVLASTKVVNNAKKYQNALLQRKMNLQRAAMTYSAQNGSRNITLNNLKNNDAARPSSPKITAASKTQRLVINLGSDTDSDAELDDQTARTGGGDAQTETRKPLAIPTTDFEKSVVQFLKDQRKKLESSTVSRSPANSTTTAAKTAPNSTSPATGKLSGLYNTPLAVRRHLPMSQQEEYRRLKQQIMERERQKLQKTIENGSLNPSLKSPCTPPGPLSPASPIAAAAQRSQANQKASSVAAQVATGGTPASSNIDKTPENLVALKKIELAKANESRPVAGVTKVSKTIVPAIPSKQLTKPLASSFKVNSITPSVPTNALPPKIPAKIPPKASANFPSNTSTPKPQSSIASKTYVAVSSRASLPLARAAVAPAEEKRGRFDAEAPGTSRKFVTESSAGLTSRNATGDLRWSLGAISAPSLPGNGAATSVGRRASNPTEMLTIQIPNDKIQTDGRSASTGISKRESSSPPNGRNVGMLKILTKEQLNSRFVQIKVKQGPSGRTVTVGGSPLSQDDAGRSAGSSPIPRVSSEGRGDKSCCDSSLIVNESTVTRRGDKRAGESVSGDSEASTLVLSRSEGDSRKDGTVDSDASTFVLDRNDGAHNDSTADSAASTFVMIHNNSECRESPGTAARADEHEDGGLATNAGVPRLTRSQARDGWEKIRSDVKIELEILTALPVEQQRVILMESQENLVAKRNMILDDLTAMSSCLHQWEVEREIQMRLIAEVRRLREQLRTAERQLHEQRRQMNGMGPKVCKAHEKINQGRGECYRLSRICHGLGSNIIGEDYKIPDTGAQLLNERMKEVAVHTRQLSKKKVPPIGSTSNSGDASSPVSSIGSDSVSETSLVDRPAISTTPLSETTNIGETTNSLTSKIHLGNTTVVRENLEPLETSNANSPRPDPVSERADPPAKKVEEEKSSEANASLIETEASGAAKKETPTTSGEGSSETNAQTVENEESSPLEINAQTGEKEASSSSECNTNDSSDVPATNLISEDRFEDIPMASTSKSCSQGQLTSSDVKPHVKTKIGPYKSVLTHLKSTRSVNPEGILCPYELMGTCSDGDCQFYHLDPGHCQ